MNPGNTYPKDWPEIALNVKAEALWQCVRCRHPNHRHSGHVLTVHHLDGDKANCRWWNLAALCQRCHLRIQGRVVMEQYWMFDHSEWFRPFAAGYYAAHDADLQEMPREWVVEHMDEILDATRKVASVTPDVAPATPRVAGLHGEGHCKR